MVLDSLAYHPGLNHLLKFNETTTGRDKIGRIIQYWAKFMAWAAYRKGYGTEVVKLFSNISSELSKARKIFRVGKFLNNIKLAVKAYDDHNSDPIIRFFIILRNVFYAGYFYNDSNALLYLLGIRKATKTKSKAVAIRRASEYWFAGLISSVLCEIYRIVSLRLKKSALLREVNNNDNLNEKEKEKDKFFNESIIAQDKATVVNVNKLLIASKTQLLQDVFDLFLPVGVLFPGILDDGIIGIAGFCSSAIGLRTQWEKTL